MTKPKLNIREMIRSGEIDTARAGQLLSVHYYTKAKLLSSSDERALRDTAKDIKLFNAYMGGGRELREGEIFLIGLASESKLANQKLAWIGAELKHTISRLYTAPQVVALTEEAYERIGKEKREKRLKRTYTLVTLYRIFAENFVYSESKLKGEEKSILDKAREYPEDAIEGNVYGLDLIDPNGKGDVIEYWRGWIPYHHNAKNLDTIDKIGDEIPELHGIIQAGIYVLYKEKKLDIPDPSTIPLDQWHDTPIKGSELAKIEENLLYLQDILNRAEYSLLDDYKDEGETEEQASNRSLYEKYSQTYTIIKNPEKVKHKLKDGILPLDPDGMYTLWGYRGDDKLESVGAKAPIEIIKDNRAVLKSNLLILYVFTEWRKKVGELLGVHKTDEFKAMTDYLEPSDLFSSYEFYLTLLIGQLKETYILPEYRVYTDMIIDAYKPLGESELLTPEYMESTLKELKERGQDLPKIAKEMFIKDKSVAKALPLIDDMTIYSIEETFYALRDALSPLINNKAGTDNG